jgi:hypothetical protein
MIHGNRPKCPALLWWFKQKPGAFQGKVLILCITPNITGSGRAALTPARHRPEAYFSGPVWEKHQL